MNNAVDPLKNFPARLKRKRRSLGLSQRQLSDQTDVSLKTVQKYEYGDIPRGRSLVSLARALHCSIDWLLLGSDDNADPSPGHIPQDRGTLIHLPHVLPRLKDSGEAFEDSQEKNKYAFHRDWLQQKGDPSQMVLMEVSGNLMSPEIKDGDTVLIDQSQREVYIGKIYAVSIGQEVLVRYVDRVPGKFILRGADHQWNISINLQEEMNDPMRILGRVIWWCRDAG